MTTLRIATRRSALALAQAEEVAALLSANAFRSEIVAMSTSGDEGVASAESPSGMKGLWVDRILEALRRGEVDVAVHSAKDLPAEDEDDIVIAAVPKRADPLDVLIGREATLPPGLVVGTSSVRRRAQLLAGFPGMGVTAIRGNVDTRLRKLADGEVDGLVLAAAGSRGSGSTRRTPGVSGWTRWPAPGQGSRPGACRGPDHGGRRLRARSPALTPRAGGGTGARPAPRRRRDLPRGARRRERGPDPHGGARRDDRRREGGEGGVREHRSEHRRIDPRTTPPGRGRRPDPRAGDAGRKRTLAGRTIIVTRPVEQAEPLVRALERRGARVLIAPTIRIVPARSAALTAALKELADGRFEWITLTSRATVDVLRDRLVSPRVVRAKVAVIGDGTAEAFRRWTRRDPDLQPSTFTTSALARALPRGRGRVLCARADIAPAGLEAALARKDGSPSEWMPTGRSSPPLPREAR